MTSIFVAKRTGILREPDGTQHRLYAGKTLAAGTHPAVTGSPESWRPMTIDLDAPGETDSQDTEADPALFFERMQIAESDRDGLIATLSAVVAAFDSRGLFVDVDRDSEGWLVLAVGEVLDELADPIADEPEPVVVAAPADPDTKEGRAVIRQWARGQGIEVSEHGQLARSVVEAYERNHA